MNNHDLHFMEHAMALAKKGVGLASPNPTVGCVIVKDGAIVGEGFHKYDARDHAEMVALKQAGEKARGATVYVTLEPCNHSGRTGPCSESLISSGVSRVFAAMEDPNSKTAGAGLARLRAAGVEVEAGILEPEAQKLNEAFSYWITKHKPFVTLKSALTLDGQLALSQKRGKKRIWITSEESRAEVQRMRHASDALLTGIGTILADNPLLTDRSGLPRRRRLLRVILDAKLRLPSGSRLVESAENDVLVFTAMSLNSPKARKLQNAGVEIIRTKHRNGKIDLTSLVAILAKRELLSVLLESGPRLNATALEAGIVQKLVLFYAPKISGKTTVPFFHGVNSGTMHCHVRSVQQFGPDIAIEASL